MIDRNTIVRWHDIAPWNDYAQVEQDLLISRALVAIFSDEFLAENLAFRGGTALHKLYLSPQARYSEDIDLVQINPGPIKPIMYRLGEVLDFLPDRVTKQKRFNNTMLFRVDSEIPPIVQLRIKVEINCFEHFNVMGYSEMPFNIESDWFTGKCNVKTYHFDELLGTKMRALYQRKKGRDLFDLYHALTTVKVNTDDVIACYKRYMEFVVAQPPSYKQYVANMEMKMQDDEFLHDMDMLIRPELSYAPITAYETVKTQLIDKLK